jgi:hypothetical protein
MSNTRFKLTFSIEKKSNQSNQSGLVRSEKRIGLNKSEKLTMYVALITLVAAVFKFGAVALNLLV